MFILGTNKNLPIRINEQKGFQVRVNRFCTPRDGYAVPRLNTEEFSKFFKLGRPLFLCLSPRPMT